MSDVKRCPTCGAQNPSAAEWCTLCLSRFDGAVIKQRPPEEPSDAILELTAIAAAAAVAEESAQAEIAVHESIPAPDQIPDAPPPPVAQSPVTFVREGDTVRWSCPSCGTVNDMDLAACRICGTVMARLFAPPETKPEKTRRSPTTTVALSAVLPGLGHAVEGSTPLGVSRALLYLWTLGISILLISRAPVRGRWVVQSVGFLFAAAAAGIWLVSLAESYRLASGDATPVLKPKMITWLFTALTLALFVGVVIAAAAGRS